MDNPLVDRVVNAVLYEGYLLYPYRRSLKNAKRCTFGTLHPAGSRAVRASGERSTALARVLVEGSGASIDGEVRFLHAIERTASDDPTGSSTWHDFEERRIALCPRTIQELLANPCRQPFDIPARRWQDADVLRYQPAIRGVVDISAAAVEHGAYLLRVSISNESQLDHESSDPSGSGASESRNIADACDSEALATLASAHLILHASAGQFISRIDPPAPYGDLCLSDPADGLWPVLIGELGQCVLMLCSPIILYDYPQIAPESPGEFFDATEIDEMLTLRVMTLSDEEKLQMAALDARGRAVLDRTQQFSERQLAQLHGATRFLRPIQESQDGI